MQSIRTVALHGITLPVRVSHGNLSADQRIDNVANRIDTLQVSLEVEYESHCALQVRSMDGAWNYGDVYAQLCLSDVPTITGPLEGILDTTLDLIEASAGTQHLALVGARVAANRIGLSVGYPQLVVGKQYQAKPVEPLGKIRTAGICDFPLVVAVDHSWCRGSQRVEHVDVRTESVSLSFRAETRAGVLASDNLAGLYNYAGLINKVQKMQGIELCGPVEQLCDLVTQVLEEDARKLGVDLRKTVVEVRRTGYARCTPVLTLTNYFD
jgi:dihydroneopterin aldolase